MVVRAPGWNPLGILNLHLENLENQEFIGEKIVPGIFEFRELETIVCVDQMLLIW